MSTTKTKIATGYYSLITGYKELFKVLDGEWELPMAVERIKKNTRVYAKKQMTWYKHDADIHWLDADKMNTQEMLKTIEDEVFVA